MPVYYLEPMRQEDVAEVSQVDHLCFSNPWPQSAYRRELRKPQSNYYVILRRAEHSEPDNGASEPEDTRGRFGFLPLPWRTESPRRQDPVVGFAGMWIMFDEAHITTIGVHPTERGNGLGELLLVQLFVEATARGAEMMTLEVRVSNDAAQTLYQKYGFERHGVRRRYYSDNGEDAYIMWSPNIRDPEYVERFYELRGQLLERLGRQLVTAPDESTVDQA